MLALAAALVLAQQSPQVPTSKSTPPTQKKPQAISLADECGDPTTVSDAYGAQKGKVTRILGPNVLDVTLDDNRRCQITLVGTSVRDMDAVAKGRARAELQRVALGHDVEVLTHGFLEDESRSFSARVFVSQFGDLSQGGELNLVLIELGMVRYVHKVYALDWWTACHYERAESEAKRNRRGVWSKGSEARSN